MKIKSYHPKNLDFFVAVHPAIDLILFQYFRSLVDAVQPHVLNVLNLVKLVVHHHDAFVHKLHTSKD